MPLDETRGWDEASKAFTHIAVPSQVTVKLSSIENVSRGVFTKESISKDTRIGPYKGKIVKREDIMDDTDTSYFWEVCILLKIVTPNNCILTYSDQKEWH